jgi:hypothetical protein
MDQCLMLWPTPTHVSSPTGFPHFSALQLSSNSSIPGTHKSKGDGSSIIGDRQDWQLTFGFGVGVAIGIAIVIAFVPGVKCCGLDDKQRAQFGLPVLEPVPMDEANVLINPSARFDAVPGPRRRIRKIGGCGGCPHNPILRTS